MQQRVAILCWLLATVGSLCVFEIANLTNWRSAIPWSSVAQLETTFTESNQAFPLELVTFTGIDSVEIDGFNVLQRSIDAVECPIARYYLRSVRDSCCSDSPADCDAALKNLSRSQEAGSEFWVIYDKTCSQKEGVAYDQVAFSPSLKGSFLHRWLALVVQPLSGPFKSASPLSTVRLLVAESLGTKPTGRLVWDPVSTFSEHVRAMLAALSPVTEVVFDTNVVYSADGDAILRAMSLDDAYERSRLVNKELAQWTGTGHLLEFGSSAPISLENVAIVLVNDDSKSGIFQVSEWGVLNFVHISDLFACNNAECILSPGGADKMNDFIISLFRSWLGLNPQRCFGDCEFGLSRTELVHLAVRQRAMYIQSVIRDMKKQFSVLQILPRLKVNKLVSDLMAASLASASEASSTHSVFEGVVKAKQAASLAAEVLHHESVKADGRFSIEYLFALYAPISLPVIMPLVSAVVAEVRKRRSKNKLIKSD